MRPDMMIVEMANIDQHTCLPRDTDTGSTLPKLPDTMPNGRARRVTTVEGGYHIDVSCLEILLRSGERATTCQAGGSIEAIWIRCHLLDLHMWLRWITVLQQ